MVGWVAPLVCSVDSDGAATARHAHMAGGQMLVIESCPLIIVGWAPLVCVADKCRDVTARYIQMAGEDSIPRRALLSWWDVWPLWCLLLTIMGPAAQRTRELEVELINS